jgi:hypothetical protein
MRELLLGIAVILSLAAGAQGQWKRDGKEASGGPEYKIKDGFGAYLVLIPKPLAIVERYELAKPGEVPYVGDVHQVKDGEAFGAAILYGGCEQSPTLGCQLEIHYWVYSPDGSLYTSQAAPAQWTGIRITDKQVFAAAQFLNLKFRPLDARGTYRIVARVRDVKRDITLDLETGVVLEEALNDRMARPN